LIAATTGTGIASNQATIRVIARASENIPVVEIENLLYRHQAVRQVAIVAMPDVRLGERAWTFVVPREAASFAFADMQEFLRKSGVARSYWPERLELVEAPAANTENERATAVDHVVVPA